MGKIERSPEKYEDISLGDYFEQDVYISKELVMAFAELTDRKSVV
jgi:hypothetical protein